MATVSPAFVWLDGERQIAKFTWAITSANLDGAPIGSQYGEYADRTIYVVGGTWGGATLAWQGGDGVNFVVLTDAQTVAISKSADFCETVIETPEFTRPFLTTAGVGAAITVTAICRRGYKRT